MGTKTQELAERLQSLTSSLEKAKTARARAEMQLREARKNVTRLQGEKAEIQGDKEGLEIALQQATTDLDEANAELAVKRTRIDELNEELRLLDATRQEALRQEAELKKTEFEKRQTEEARELREEEEKLERTKTRGILRTAALVVFFLNFAAYGVLFLFNKVVPTPWYGLPFLLGALTWFADSIANTMEAAWPHFTRYWRPISIVISLFISGTIATIGLTLGDYTGVLQWLLVWVVYGALIHGLVELVHGIFMFDENEDQNKATYRKVVLANITLAVMGGIIMATTPNNMFEIPKSPANALIYMVLCILAAGIMAAIGTAGLFLSRFFFPKFLSAFCNLFRKEVKRQRLAEGSNRFLKLFAAGVGLAVGCIVASSFQNKEPGLMMQALPWIAGSVIMVLFFMTESKMLEACANAIGALRRAHARRYLWIGFLVALIFTVPMSFPKMYQVVSASSRAADEKAQLLDTMNTFYSSVKSTLDRHSQKAEKRGKHEKARQYKDADDIMQDAMDMAEASVIHADRELAAERFRRAASEVKDLLPREEREKKIWMDVKVFPEPVPIELVMHLLGIKQIEGMTDRYAGQAVIGLIGICGIDLALIILGLVLYLTRRRKEEDETLLGQGQIGTMREGGKRCLVIVDKIPTGVEIDDTLNVIGENGAAISTLLVEKPDGDAGFDCRVMNPNQQVKMGLRVALVNVDAGNGHMGLIPTPPADTDWGDDSCTSDPEPAQDEGPDLNDWAVDSDPVDGDDSCTSDPEPPSDPDPTT